MITVRRAGTLLRSCRWFSSKFSQKCVVLGIETSCDDTGAAVVNNEGKILGETVISQQLLHLRYGGINPPKAQDLHRENIEKAVKDALQKADISFKDLDAIAVTNRPGLPMSLLIGLRYARYLAREHSKPLVPVHHMEAHATAARITEEVPYPFLCLLISGGHSQLALVKSPSEFYLLGESIDNAPGEAFDKVARRMRLHHLLEFSKVNGGLAIETAAKKATDPNRFEFPLPLARYKDCQFSFAGLKNSAYRAIKQQEIKHDLAPDEVIPHYADFCAGFLKAVTRHISNRTQRAIEYCDKNNHLPKVFSRSLVISGGVACNDFIFHSVAKMAETYGMKTFRPLKKYCSDNGVMIAWNGIENIMVNKDAMRYDFNEIDVEGKCNLGRSLIDDVKEAEIKCKWVKVNM